MEGKVVDARELGCPQPVILTRRALQESDAVTAIVDNETAQRNVTRMAEKSGYTVEGEQRGDGIYLYIGDRCELPEEETAQAMPASPSGPLVLVVSSEYMGRGEHPELGHVLIRGFFHALGEVEPDQLQQGALAAFAVVDGVVGPKHFVRFAVVVTVTAIVRAGLGECDQ